MINISKLLDSVPKTTIQPRQSNLQGILSLIARMSDQSRSAPEPPSMIDGLGSGIGAGFAKGADMAVSHMMSKDLQTSAQDFQASENQKSREFTQGENKLNREFTAGENALNREQRSIEFASEQKYRQSRLDLERQIAQSNEDINWEKLVQDGERLAEQTRVNNAQIALTNAETKIKEAVDPKERARLESERNQILLEQAKTEGKTAELKLKEVTENLKAFSPEEMEAAKAGRFEGMNPERARGIQGLLQSRAQIEALGDKSDKAMHDKSTAIIADAFVNPEASPEGYINAIQIYRRSNKTTPEMDNKEAKYRNQVTNQIRKGVQDIKIDYSKPETLAQASNLLQSLDLSSLDAKGKSDLENQFFEKKLIPALQTFTTDFNNRPQQVATNIALMNQLKMERGSQPLIPVMNDTGGLKSFRSGTPEEFNQWLNSVRGLNAP